MRAPAPAIFYVHGGGMVGGGRRAALQIIMAMAAPAEIAVVSVEYRLAPEHPFPAAVEDCYAGLAWTVGHATEFGVDPDRIVIAGNSAGGGLAAALALLARDRGGPAVRGQMLMAPMLDDRNNTVSARQMDGVGLWDRTSNLTGWRALLGSAQGGQDVSPYAAPSRANDLSGLPAAFIDVGSAETFRDEAVTYASNIWRAGGTAELHVWPGGFHGYDLIAVNSAIAESTHASRRDWLRRLLIQ